MKSIRLSLLRRLLLGLGLALAGAGAMLYLQIRSVLTREFDAVLRAKAATLVSLTEQDGGNVEMDSTTSILPEFGRHEYFQLWLPDGQTLKRSPNLSNRDLPRRAGDLTLPDGQPGRAVAVEFVPKPADEDQTTKLTEPVVTLIVAGNIRAMRDRLALIRVGLLLVGALLEAVTVLVVTLTVYRGLAPLAAVGRQVIMIDASSLQSRFAIDKMPSELRPICERLNDLLARLEDAFQRERRISADIAHELRTPIAELRSLSEVALKWPDDAASTGHAFRDALAIAQKMETTVVGLLALARCEEGKQPIAPEPVAVAALVEELWSGLIERALRHQLDVTVDVPHELSLTTDRALLRLILENLLANAVEYTPVRGAVRVNAGQRNGQFQLTIANTTDNLSARDVPHLFERFWRKDPARTGSEHTGLGLSVARAGAVALGLNLVAEMRGADTLCVALAGPAVAMARQASRKSV